ncbi:replication initiation protein [Cetobacterium sp.]|uniref:replication initiation protein n=1 Tax=Cetobacterium sp. TaxID=2071632 RepID=UPI003F3CFD35
MKIMKYHNDINKMKIGGFSKAETDIFFSLLLKAKDNQDKIIIMDFLELKQLSNGDKNNDRFIKNILGLSSKLKTLNQTMEVEPGVFLTFSLFGSIRTDTNKKIIKVPIGEEFSYLVKGLLGNFTLLDLEELVKLTSNYSKTLFRLLKQWETTKEYIVKMDVFKELMGVPSTYRMTNIDQKVLNPSMEELKSLFPNLKLEKTKKGRVMESLKFTWTQKKKIDPKIIPIKIKKGLGQKELEEDKLFELERDDSISQGIENTDAENPLWVKFLELSIAEQASVVETVYQNYILECGANGKIQKLAFNASKKSLITKFLENNREESSRIQDEDLEFTQTKIYTVEDIPSEKLLDKNGNKLKGMLLVNRINKILGEMNKAEAV